MEEPPLQSKTAIVLVAAQWEECTGYYQSQNNQDAFLYVGGTQDTLIVRPMWKSPEMKYLPESGVDFFNADRDKDDHIRFVKDELGHTVKAIISDSTSWNKVKMYLPVKEVKLSLEQLKSLEGKYTFKFPDREKEDVIQIAVSGNGLVLHEAWSAGNGRKYIPFSETRFRSQESPFSVEFIKDSRGAVTHCLVIFPQRQDRWTKSKIE
jgi:hypothetical protein